MTSNKNDTPADEDHAQSFVHDGEMYITYDAFSRSSASDAEAERAERAEAPHVRFKLDEAHARRLLYGVMRKFYGWR